MTAPEYTLEQQIVRSGWDGEWFWSHARPGVIPRGDGRPPTIVIPMHPSLRAGCDYFGTLHSIRSDDGGATWGEPVAHEAGFGPREAPDGWTVRFCDPYPAFHRATGRLLVTGQSAWYLDAPRPPVNRPREAAWSVYDEANDAFSSWRAMDPPSGADVFETMGPGSAQWHELEDGTILLPVYAKPRSDDVFDPYVAAVLRCAFDGETLRCLESGVPVEVPGPRGACEPSITRFNGRYYLTIRNDERGWVAVSDDGLRFEAPVPWTFDDGTELGNYNTQQHWVTHSEGLYLVYTRRGLDNDHVFRRRAPLMMAQVDADRPCVLRDTERELVPERGARIGNFGVADVTADETWVTVAEYMQPAGCEARGSDNAIWAARIRWATPNRRVP